MGGIDKSAKFIRAFNDKNSIFQPYVYVYRKRALNNKICYCVCEILPLCAFSFVHYTQCDRFVKRLLDAGNDIFRPV